MAKHHIAETEHGDFSKKYASALWYKYASGTGIATWITGSEDIDPEGWHIVIYLRGKMPKDVEFPKEHNSVPVYVQENRHYMAHTFE